jgi:hypothetical protein
MAVRTRVQPLSRDIEILLTELQEIDGADILTEFARAEITEAKEINRAVLGREPPVEIFVDGRKDESLRSVETKSVIVAEFQLVTEVLVWIAQQLEQHSPVKTGRYQKSHILLADGVEVTATTQVLTASEYVFINTQPYARKIERGSSSMAPDGVYQAVATLARQRFGNITKVAFSYRTVIGGSIVTGSAGNRSSNRNPAIIVTPR